jgi:hypothetical protein
VLGQVFWNLIRIQPHNNPTSAIEAISANEIYETPKKETIVAKWYET